MRRLLTSIAHYIILSMPFLGLWIWACGHAYPYLYSENNERERDYYYYQMAVWHANQPLADSMDSLVFRKHNPGFFLFASQMLIRAGCSSMYSLHMASLVLVTATLIMVYLLLRSLFRNRWIALFALCYIVFTYAFRQYSININAIAYGRFFTVAACLAYLYYLRGNRRWLLALACCCYFLACWNYWERYVETALLLWGIHFVERERFFSRSLIPLAIAPVLALGSFFLVAAQQMGGGFTEVAKEMHHMAVLRSVDVATEQHVEHQSLQYITLSRMVSYFGRMGGDITKMYFITPAVWALMLAAVLFAHHPDRRRAYRILPFVFASAFYWHLLMYQHIITMQHIAYHHYLFMAILFGCFVVEIPGYVYRNLQDRPCKALLAGALIFPAVFPATNGVLKASIPTFVYDAKKVDYVRSLNKSANSEDKKTRETARRQLNIELHKRVKWHPYYRQDIALNVLQDYLPWRSDRPNLLPNGDFETWTEESMKSVQPPHPKFSTVSREEKQVGSGKYAIRQTWREDDGAASIHHQFAYIARGLKPKTDYAFKADVLNARGGEVIVSAVWYKGGSGKESIERLRLEVLRVPPTAGAELREFMGVFTTPDTKKPIDVRLLSQARPDKYKRGDYVIWDNWELRELGPKR